MNLGACLTEKIIIQEEVLYNGGQNLLNQRMTNVTLTHGTTHYRNW